MYYSELTNGTIVIRSAEAAELIVDEYRISGKAAVEVRWFPKPRLVVQCEFERWRVPELSDRQCTIEIPAAEVSATVYCLKRTDVGSVTTMILVPKGHPIERKLESNLSRVVFHLTNLPDFLGSPGREIKLEADRWQITVTPVPDINEQVKKLKDFGGYSITHVGEIRHSDNTVFDLEDSNDLLTALHYFFSFVRGFWVSPLLPIGYNSGDSVVWEQWGMKTIDSWQGILSWLDVHHGDSISSLFPGFWGKWKDEAWRDSIEYAIYWYVRSNNGANGIDASIILAQAALELLCWNSCVKNNGNLSKSEFRKLSAADKLRLLLVRTGIPHDVPAVLQELTKLSAQYDRDGADVFIQLRNSLVHPERTREGEFLIDNAITEGWLLGMWYLELIMLRLFDYNGVYSIRLKSGGWVGDVEDVPWSNST